jgi:hypothetical protein
VVAPPGVEQVELQGVHVLELVHEQVAEAPALGGGEGGIVVQGVAAQLEQVVEVDQAVLALVLLVTGVVAGDLVGRDGGSTPGGGRPLGVAVGAQ